MMDHLDAVRKRIRAASVGAPVAPWSQVAVRAVGGLTEVGFADDTDLLLVVSSRGRGVFDCCSGQIVARDQTEPDDGWYDERRLRALQRVQVSRRLLLSSSPNSTGEALVYEPVELATLPPRDALTACQRKIKAGVIACLCHWNAAAASDAERLLRGTGCRKARDCCGG